MNSPVTILKSFDPTTQANAQPVQAQVNVT